MSQIQFWNEIYGQQAVAWPGAQGFLNSLNAFQKKYLSLFPKDLKDKHVLELGCGRGEWSVLAASLGATVQAIDNSDSAIQATQQLAGQAGVGQRVTARRLDASKLEFPDSSFDLVCGQMILHHLEPFEQVCQNLQRILKPGGVAVFYENSASNPVLMFMRGHVAGKLFGVPRYGDMEEHPLTRAEVGLFKKYFSKVQVFYPEVVFFKKINTYVFKHRIKTKIFDWLDALLHAIPFLRWLSYEQVILVKKV